MANPDAPSKPTRRSVRANLIEATPGAAGQWILALPFLAFAGWYWIDLFVAYSSIPWRWLEVVIAVALYVCVIVLPLGLLAHRLVTSLPGIFQHAGWDIQPLESVSDAEQYTVNYTPVERIRAESTWSRRWLRAAQGSVYLEIAALLIGAILLIPIFLSATNYGFGR